MKKRNLIILMFLMMCCLICIVAPVVAKYVKEKNSVINISSDEFYFTVDLLGDTNSEDSLEKTFQFYGGDKKEVTFSVQNYFDEFRITESDIKYTISLDVNLPTGSVYDSSSVLINDLSDKTLAKSAKSSNLYTLTVPEGYDNNTEVVITISSTIPYTKTMKLTFVLKTFESEVSYYVIDSAKSLYAELFVTTNVPIPVGKLLVDFSNINSSSNALQVDMTNMYLIDKNGVLNKIEDGETYLKKVNNTIMINTGEAISIKFFKGDISKDYSLESTNINGVSEENEKIYKIIITESE